MIEQPAIARSVVALRKLLLKSLNVQPAHTLLASVDPTEKPDIAVVGKQIHHLIVLRFINKKSVRVLHATNLVDVLLYRKLVLKFLHAGGQG